MPCTSIKCRGRRFNQRLLVYGETILNYLIVIAGSGRMLAQAARTAGFRPLVIDLFADLDSQYYAEEILRVPSLAAEHVAPAIDYFVQRYGATDLIYGSGFEYYPDSLFYLRRKLNILGNQPETFCRLQHKPAFFSVLAGLEIPFPKVSFTAPHEEPGWLFKPLRGQGGRGIRCYRQNDASCSSGYWQQFQSGTPHSVLFIANGRDLAVIGFNRQWTIELNESEPFVFSGVMNYTELPEESKHRIVAWLTRLVPEFNLKGLNSLDFIQDGEISRVLEINPRPPASMQLYGGNLLTAHVEACRGALPCGLPSQCGYQGYQILYARQAVKIPECFSWPEGCMDLPPTGSIIGAKQPICSMIAHHSDFQIVLKQLADTELTLNNKLERAHAIYC